MTTPIKRFLIIDDDPINNLLSKMVLRKSFGEVYITDFIIPEDGLEFIESGSGQHPHDGKITLFLDINMPSISGWEFLEKFKIFNASIKEQYNIYILSSLVNTSDINRAKENSLVVDFIEKPLSKTKLLNIFG